MFANGTHLFVSDFDIENLFETMSKELRKRTTWFKASNVSLNISKTKYCSFYSLRKRKVLPNISPPLHTDKSPIKGKFFTKFLVVYLNENISSKYHINIVTIKVCKNIGILYRTRCILNKFLRKQFYFSFINCYLNYANLVWTSTKKSKLQALYHYQIHTARIINLKDKFTSAKPLTEQIIAITMYEMNIFQILTARSTLR